jgi:flagellar P-ring protein precursor FlgI
MHVLATYRRETGTNTREKPAAPAAVVVLCLLGLSIGVTTPASATRIADVTHLKGQRQNTLLGYGLVIGLPGTGDGGKYLPPIMMLTSMLEKFEIPVPPGALKDTKNVAIVMVEATLPENGVREGDRINVRVSSTGAAKSLGGGYLVPTPLQGPGLDTIFAFASGQIRLPDPKLKTGGIITEGATMEEDVIHNYVAYNESSQEWEFTLVLEDVHASFTLATVIAQMINENASEIGQVRRIARAVGPKNVLVTIPKDQLDNPAEFIARMENTELLMPRGEARIVINRKTQTIVIGDGVRIGPAVIAHRGMTITTTSPPPKPTVEEPLITEQHLVAIDVPKHQRRSAKLKEVVDALNQLNVPAKDIIEIVEELYRSGKVAGKLVIQD